jgi:predicted dehydrogenase
MSEAWIAEAQKRGDCEIVGLVDVNVGASEAKKAKHKLSANTYTSIAAALDKEDANLVFDVTVPEAHFEVVTAALKAGCDVFGEKPMADTLENAEKMVACANETKREYFIMQNRRYLPMALAFKEFLLSKALGEVGQISADFQKGPHFGGFRDEMDSPLIADMAIHIFDTARFLTGKNAVSVYCHEFNPPWSWYKGDASAVCVFEMEDGSIFDFRGSWCANGLATSWDSEWRAACAGGAVFWDGAGKLHYGVGDDGQTQQIREIMPIPMEQVAHPACINEMFRALGDGRRPQTDCRDNINSIKMVFKAIESAKQRKPVVM